ncbi:MAG: hypothetical protein L0154_15580 [Chloroflexi bacterium]|nr:hypothetical protein [Chloroflexota bacterium]
MQRRNLVLIHLDALQPRRDLRIYLGTQEIGAAAGNAVVGSASTLAPRIGRGAGEFDRFAILTLKIEATL